MTSSGTVEPYFLWFLVVAEIFSLEISDWHEGTSSTDYNPNNNNNKERTKNFQYPKNSDNSL